MTLTLLKTIPSGSHNAPFTCELGSHWPEGQQFKLLPKSRYPSRMKATSIAVEQIGGEEVIVIIPRERFAELFGVEAPK